MIIDTIVVGNLQTNCYILKNDKNVIVIDPGDEANSILSHIDEDEELLGIIITHSHFDHVGAIEDIKRKHDVPIYSFSNLVEGVNQIKNFSFEVIHTIGHTDDSISLYFENYSTMFVGDFIFKNSIGRTDLGGNDDDMKRSIKKILEYDSNTFLYPGHGPKTILKDEINNLQYFIDIL